MSVPREVGEDDWCHRVRRIAHGWLFDDIPEGALPRRVILPLENPDLHDRESFARMLSGVRTFRALTTGTYRGTAVGVLSSKFGAPAVAMTVELLAAAGVETVTGVGYCGVLRSDIGCGDLVLPLACVRDEGVTSHFVAPGYPAVADLDALGRLRRAAAAGGHPCHSGLVWSTDAVLGETSRLVEHWGSRGVSAVDMEAAALYVVARVAGVRAACVLVASDSPAAGHAADPAALERGHREAVKAAFESLVSERTPDRPSEPGDAAPSLSRPPTF